MSDIHMLRHAVATVVYRAAKVFRNAPEGFGTYRLSAASRSPVEILSHIGDLFDWAHSMASGQEVWHDSSPGTWEEEISRFYSAVGKFDAFLSHTSAPSCSTERLFQGPVADALTHVGQLAMLRRLGGSPVRGENYFKAEIVAGRVGPEQDAPRREFE
jgi:hypothetical protein